jgi:hypothetical protein
MVSFCEHGNEISGSIKANNFLTKNYLLFKKDPAPRISKLFSQVGFIDQLNSCLVFKEDLVPWSEFL